MSEGRNCGKKLEPLKRNKYFYGKLLTVRDFEDEQRYQINKDRLSNIFSLTGGIICGLEVTINEDRLTVNPGIAVDRCGNFIIVPSSKTIQIDDFEGEQAYLMINYKESETEPVSNLLSSSPCEDRCEYNRILEGFDIFISTEKLEAEKGVKEVDLKGSNIDEIYSEFQSSYYEKHLKRCPEFSEKAIVLAVLKKTTAGVKIDPEETKKFRMIVFTNQVIRDVLFSHLSDFKNPHGSLKSINKVGNSGSKKVNNIDLVPSSEKEIFIKPEKSKNRIVIGIADSFKEDIDRKIQGIKCIKSINDLESEKIYIVSKDRTVTVKSSGREIDLSVSNILPEIEKKRILQKTAYEFDLATTRLKDEELMNICLEIFKGCIEYIKDQSYIDNEKFLEALNSLFNVERVFLTKIEDKFENLRIEQARIKMLLESADRYSVALENKEIPEIIDAKTDFLFYLSIIRPKTLG
ncbi:hypothetical protein [Persephonella sp.]